MTSLIQEEEQTRLASDPRRLDIWQAFIKTSKVWQDFDAFDVNKHLLAYYGNHGNETNKDSPYLTTQVRPRSNGTHGLANR